MADEEIEFCECTCACCSGCTGQMVTWHPVPDSMIELVPVTNEDGSYSAAFLAAARGEM